MYLFRAGPEHALPLPDHESRKHFRVEEEGESSLISILHTPSMRSSFLPRQVGDAVAAGELYCEVETDKATMGWEAQEDGFIAQILQPSGAKDVSVGTPVIVMVEEKESVAAFAAYTSADGSKPQAPASAPAQPTPAAASAKQAAAPAVAAAAAAPRAASSGVLGCVREVMSM